MNGREFLAVLDQEEKRLQIKAESYAKLLLDEPNLPDEVRTEINVAIGELNLLSRGKFKQFRGLCQANIGGGHVLRSSSKTSESIPLDSDLAGFWDITSPLIDKLKMKFHQFDRRRNQQWATNENEIDPHDVNRRPRVVDERTKKVVAAPPSRKVNDDLKKLIDERRRTAMTKNSNPSDVEIFLPEKE